MNIPQQVSAILSQSGYGAVVSSQPVGGGCINNGHRLTTASGETFFLKTNHSAPDDMFAREAEGLQALHQPGGPYVPGVQLHGASFILLEDLAPGAPTGAYWLDFGHQLAALHNHTSDRFGFQHDNYIGSTPQPNAWTEDGYQFFNDQRLLFQARLANRRGLLGRKELTQVERICARLSQLIPSQPASLIHGDLWSGNATSNREGEPAIIDPAAHYGWAEAELAMTALFGSFPETFYRAYLELRPLEADFRSRFPIYNLYHLLNHLNLFGSSYLGQVVQVLNRFSR